MPAFLSFYIVVLNRIHLVLVWFYDHKWFDFSSSFTFFFPLYLCFLTSIYLKLFCVCLCVFLCMRCSAAVQHRSLLSMLPTCLTPRSHSHCLSSPPTTWAAIMTLIAQELTLPLSGFELHCALRAICVPILNRFVFKIPKLQEDRERHHSYS